jgi:hypothetical protein
MSKIALMRVPSEPMPPPVKEPPPDAPENPDIPVREPDPAEPTQIWLPMYPSDSFPIAGIIVFVFPVRLFVWPPPCV